MIIFSDITQKDHPIFTDLVNNEFIFNDYYSKKKVDVTQTWPDDSDYSSYPHINDIADDIIKNPTKYKDITVRINSCDVYSSSTEKGGFDRVEDLPVNGGYEKATESLKIESFDGKERGFISANCPSMNGFIRWHYDGKGNICGMTIVKNMGNHRFILKKRANGGKTTELLMKLHFHPVDSKESFTSILRRESDSHHTDAQNQQGQTEEQKAYSGYKSGRKEYIELIHFLRDLQIDFSDILKQEGMLKDPKNTPRLTSIAKMNGGINSGIFKKLGFDNMKWALETAKEIALHPEQAESLQVISHSAVMCFANLYYYFTNELGDQTPLMNKGDLKFFLLSTFTSKTKSWSSVMRLSDLNQSAAQKDHNVVNAVKFLRDLNDYYIAEIPTKAGARRKNGFGTENVAIKAFFNSITDVLQRNFAINESRLGV